MKIYTLSKDYQIVEIENAGERIQISAIQEGIREKDYVFLTDHPELRDLQYEVVKVWKVKELLFAQLVRVPVNQPL